MYFPTTHSKTVNHLGNLDKFDSLGNNGELLEYGNNAMAKDSERNFIF